MKISYMRMAGPINLSSVCKTSIGGWYEKRIAFLSELLRRGHQVHLLGKAEYGNPFVGGFDASLFSPPSEPDLLFIEFGSSNENFYSKQLSEAKALAARYDDRVVYLCDDPALPWFGGITSWHNARSSKPLTDGEVYDFPFASLLPWKEPRLSTIDACLIYFGRFSGRKKLITEIISNINLKIYSTEESTWCAVNTPPPQHERYDFYNKHFASLSLNDNKHKSLGWRTGRAYHSLIAGCPVILEQEAEPDTRWLRFGKPGGIEALVEEIAEDRIGVLERERTIMTDDLEICEKTFKTFGI